MNTGIILIGLALVLLSVGLISAPATAAVPHCDCVTPCFGGISHEDPEPGCISASPWGMTGTMAACGESSP